MDIWHLETNDANEAFHILLNVEPSYSPRSAWTPVIVKHQHLYSVIDELKQTLGRRYILEKEYARATNGTWDLVLQYQLGNLIVFKDPKDAMMIKLKYG